MSHAVRVNNYMQAQGTATDPLSKTFITLQWLIGLNRLPVICNIRIINLISTLYVLGFIFFMLFMIFSHDFTNPSEIVEYVKLIQYLLCCALACRSRKKILFYYKELNKFDAEVGYRPKVTRQSITILLSTIGICVSIVPIYLKKETLHFYPLHLVHTIESHYYALLFNLLNQRIHYMNHSIESSLFSVTDFSGEFKIDPKRINKKSSIGMNKLMDYYYIIINAYDLLTEGIKWQLLLIITTSFAYALKVAYDVALKIISGPSYESIEHTVLDIVLVASETVPLLAPSMCCDVLRHAVRRLRELLASKLFESKLDKSDRSIARALLALTKARNLSFSLLRMLDISISLPFSFVGLLATYLIILLQFEKVINPNAHTNAPANKT